ncbi:MAG: hypothetical protein IJ857_00540 [Lachnospiraceae bacterium]|nr:hypothetical protein [Lachnospiraceae bacterium]
MPTTVTKSTSKTNKSSRLKSHKDLKQYLEQLNDGTPQRKQEAKDALIRSGVLKKNGKRKEIIVSWE